MHLSPISKLGYLSFKGVYGIIYRLHRPYDCFSGHKKRDFLTAREDRFRRLAKTAVVANVREFVNGFWEWPGVKWMLGGSNETELSHAGGKSSIEIIILQKYAC